jgi:hypothetical protein
MSPIPEQRVGLYQITQVAPLPHLGGQFFHLIHQPTGARHIHIACPDDNKGFAVAFPTVPQDDTGVAHILEHIVLAGSQRFPVRDPFFSMGPRSLSTFMNAMTASDATIYPFSTRNHKDFFNLLEVYLDACFFPRIAYDSYRQEAWRYEFAEMENPQSALKYMGVVFNEMKGGMSVPATVMWRERAKVIYPDLTYARNSGGDPAYIPDLSWEALKAFHAHHYHPSNSYFLTYGDLDLEKTLAMIESQALRRFERLAIDTRIPNQPRFTTPRRAEAVYPVGPNEPLEKKAQVLVSWLTTDIAEGLEVLSLEVLERVLLANASSPLRKALIESGIGQALADSTGFSTGYREAAFGAGLKGVNPQDAEKIESLILGVLREQAEQGVDQAMVDAALHRLEIENREVSNAGAPYALKLYFQLSGAYLWGGDPYQALQFDHHLAELNRRRQTEPYFENLIRRYFLGNPHRVTLTLKPDPELQARQEAEEQQKLAQVRAALSEAKVQEIIAEARALKARQEAAEDKSSLPMLQVSDIPMVLEDVPYTPKQISGAKVGLFPQPTNGLAYVDVAFDFSGLPDSAKDLLPVFAFVLTKMGAGKSNYLDMATRIEAYTGGLTAAVGVRNQPDNLENFFQNFGLSGKVLYRNLEPFFAILKDFLTDLRFDKAHLKNLLGQYQAAYESRLLPQGHSFVLALAAAGLSSATALRERLEGLSQLAQAKRLSELDDEGLDGLIRQLESIRDRLFSGQCISVCVTAEEKELGKIESRVTELLAALPMSRSRTASPKAAEALPTAQARTTAVPVAYNAQVWPAVPYTHPDAPALLLLSNLFRAEYTHKEIREKGGAYGGYAVSRIEQGYFAFVSYRDPHIVRTFKVYEGAVDWLKHFNLSEEKLTEAILGAAGDVDPLLSPDSKGRTRFADDLAGFTLERRLEFKRRLLQTSKADLLRVAQTYLVGPGSRAIIGNEEKIREANGAMGGVFEVKAV